MTDIAKFLGPGGVPTPQEKQFRVAFAAFHPTGTKSNTMAMLPRDMGEWMMFYPIGFGGLPRCGKSDCSDGPLTDWPTSFPVATAGGGTFAFRSAGCFGASSRGRLELVGSDGKTNDKRVKDLKAASGDVTLCLKSTLAPKMVCKAKANANTPE